MTIIVKKPFELELTDVKSIKDINTKDINAADKQLHPEFEEKPVMATAQTSEDVHGGSELTFSLPTSQSSAQEQENGNNQANQDTQGNTSAPNADANNDNTNANAADNNGDNKGAPEQQNASGEKPNDNNEVGDNAVNTDVDKRGNESNNDTHGAQDTNDGGSSQENMDNVNEHETTVDNDTNKQESGGDSAQEQENASAESSGDSQSEGDNSNNDTEDQGQESSNEDGENDDAEGNNEGGENGSESANAKPRSSVDNGDGDTNDTNTDGGSNQEQENGDNNEQNSENDDEDEESESEDADEQSQSGTYNTQQVVDVVNAVNVSSKYYQTEFYRFIELISEEKTRTFDPMGNSEYNVKKLLFRQYERKPLTSYKMSRVKESVVILLDNSGSMKWWADNLAILADLAMQRNDVEVYLAPNGYIEEMLYPKHQLVNHDEIMKRLRNRKIIYVGDFDGADTPIILSWYNDVIWVCPEERYLNFLDHDWVHYDESRFKGAFLRVFTLQELFSAFKKLLSTPALRFWYDLCDVTHKCGGDEE